MDHTLALIGRIHQGDKEARDTLFSENMGLVYSVARRFLGRGVEMEDLLEAKVDITHTQEDLMDSEILEILAIYFRLFLQEDLEADSLVKGKLVQEKVQI